MIGGHSCPRTPCDRFVADSALEGDGFELVVPREDRASVSRLCRFVASSINVSRAREPMVRRLFAGGNRIRTLGPAANDRPLVSTGTPSDRMHRSFASSFPKRTYMLGPAYIGTGRNRSFRIQ